MPRKEATNSAIRIRQATEEETAGESEREREQARECERHTHTDGEQVLVMLVLRGWGVLRDFWVSYCGLCGCKMWPKT